MKIENKAALLSAIVYPGAGHFALKSVVIGCIFAGVFTVLLFKTLGLLWLLHSAARMKFLSGKIPMTATGVLHKQLKTHHLSAQSLLSINTYR
ncbi:hypothetical protein ACOBV8_19465 (plasmid) [Pseudoalteromonas espejiana]